MRGFAVPMMKDVMSFDAVYMIFYTVYRYNNTNLDNYDKM